MRGAGRAGGEHGQALIFITLMVPVLLGMTGLVVDYGRGAAARRDTQNAADAAALAGAGVLAEGGSIDLSRTTAVSWAEKNGFADSETTVHVPPQAGPHANDSNYVEVEVEHQVPTVFLRALNLEAFSVRSRAVAGFVPGSGNYALLVLNPTACSAFSQTSGSQLTLVGGGSMVNSSCQPSGSQGGGSSIVAEFINYFRDGLWELSNNATTSVPPAPEIMPIVDPLAALEEPVPGASSPDCEGTANNPRVTHLTGNGPVTIRPGTCYGGIMITGTGDVTFAPGLFILAGGGFNYSSASNVSGSGVTFFNTYDPEHNSGAGECDSIGLHGSGTLNLSAPTSGTYQDILFWQDPECTNEFRYGGSSYTTTGIIYLPNAQLHVSGGGNLGAMQIIVDTFSYSGSTAITIDYGDYVPIARPRLALVE